MGQDLLLPLYADDATEPCALIRIGRLHRDYQTRGFFRIGALPVACAEKVEIEITNPARTHAVLSEAGPSLLGLNRSDLIELRGFAIRFSGDSEPRLEGKRVRVTKDGAWDLVDGATLRQEGTELALPRCRLVVHGPDAGCLVVNTGQGMTRHSLFRKTKSVPSSSTPQETP